MTQSPQNPSPDHSVAPSWLSRHKKEIAVLCALLITLAGPFLIRPSSASSPSHSDRRLVIMTPHHELIRKEFAQGFTQHWFDQTGETVFVDWRVPGGTSDIALLLKSEFTNAFQQYWTRQLGRPWTREIADACLNGKLPLPQPGQTSVSPAIDARQTFLNSDLSIGVDLFFGGGPYDFYQQARAGVLVANPTRGTGGIPTLKTKHPEWFGDGGIPDALSGETFRDAGDRWIGCCLSSFGIVYNQDVLARLGFDEAPTQWTQLADPRLFGQIALSDPAKSGSVNKAFEMLIQQQMRLQLDRLTANPGALKTQSEIETEAIRQGWMDGMRLIQRISANARYFTDSSPKIPLEVSRGDAAAGMCIDYYGRSAEEQVRQADGRSRVGFVAPRGGTSVAVDPIGILRGAQEPELATAFMEYVLSDAGQRLWSYRSQTPGGPQSVALRRLPVRRDFYNPENLALMSDPEEMPFDKASDFHYEENWTNPAFNAIRFIIRVICVDAHEELRHAWKELIAADFPPEATKAFEDLELVNYETAIGTISETLASRDKIRETRLARQLGNNIRRQYEHTIKLAKRGF